MRKDFNYLCDVSVEEWCRNIFIPMNDLAYKELTQTHNPPISLIGEAQFLC